MRVKTEKATYELALREWTSNGWGTNDIIDLIDLPEYNYELESYEATEEELERIIEWCEGYAAGMRCDIPDHEYNPEQIPKEIYFSCETIESYND